MFATWPLKHVYIHLKTSFFFKENESENIEIYIAVDSMAYSFHWTPVHHISDHI